MSGVWLSVQFVDNVYWDTRVLVLEVWRMSLPINLRIRASQLLANVL